MAVRCSVARSIRRFISMKALPACRTSRAPWGLKSRLRPLPKSSARARETQDGPDLVSKEDDRDRQQKIIAASIQRTKM